MAGMVTPAHELDESGMEALLSEDFRRRELDAKRLWRAVLAITLQDAAELWPVRFPANWRPPPAKERMQRGADQARGGVLPGAAPANAPGWLVDPDELLMVL